MRRIRGTQISSNVSTLRVTQRSKHQEKDATEENHYVQRSIVNDFRPVSRVMKTVDAQIAKIPTERTRR